MRKAHYEVLQIEVTNTKDAPRDKDLFYGCKKCGGIVASVPKDNVSCHCGNISIDKDMNRLWIGKYEDLIVLKKV